MYHEPSSMLVIVASHLLQSMLEFPGPPHAEVCDEGHRVQSPGLLLLLAACRVGA